MAELDPGAHCGHESGLRQHCAKCGRWCCPTCYFPWMALACADCRTGPASSRLVARPLPEPVLVPSRAHRCRPGAHAARPVYPSHPDREAVLEERVADLERRLNDITSG